MKLSHNIAYSFILTISGYLFPLITYPYVSRVLGVTNIGICNLVDSIINYFILFSMLGIGVVGIRETAENRGDRRRLSESFRDLVAFNVFMTVIAEVLLLAAIFLVPRFGPYRNMLLIGAVKLLANLFLVEWFYKGIEDFRYITVRSIIVKALYVVSVFVFVKAPDDYPVYYLLTVCVCIANAAVNWRHLRRFVTFRQGRPSIFRYARQVAVMGCYALLTSMYTTFNVVYLGLVAGDTEVGYYTSAVKLYTLIIGLFTAFTNVMLPRMSALVSQGDDGEFSRLASLSNSLLFRTSLPLVVFTVLYAPEIIRIICGPGYEAAVLPMRIIMPLLLVVGYEQIIIVQMLMPMKKDRAVLANSILGASLGVALNLLLTPRWGSTGAAVVWVCSECAVMLSAQYFIRRYLHRGFPFRQLRGELPLIVPAMLLVAAPFLLPRSTGLVPVILSATVLAAYYAFVFLRMKKSRTFSSDLPPVMENATSGKEAESTRDAQPATQSEQ